MWSDREADAPRCEGSGRAGASAPLLADGFPHGAALCEACWAFVALEEGALASHDAFRGASDATDARRRAEWFNVHGW